MTMKIQLQDLVSNNIFDKIYPFVRVHIWNNNKDIWLRLGQTEAVPNDDDINFHTEFKVMQKFGKRPLKLKFECLN